MRIRKAYLNDSISQKQTSSDFYFEKKEREKERRRETLSSLRWWQFDACVWNVCMFIIELLMLSHTKTKQTNHFFLLATAIFPAKSHLFWMGVFKCISIKKVELYFSFNLFIYVVVIFVTPLTLHFHFFASFRKLAIRSSYCNETSKLKCFRRVLRCKCCNTLGSLCNCVILSIDLFKEDERRKNDTCN